MLYLMAAEEKDVTRSVQNSTAVCGSTATNGTITEDEVPGASLNGRKPENLKVPELKCWLACRRLPTKGKKADLIAR